MAWHRGFVVCSDQVAQAVESAMADYFRYRLVSQSGETAFAFAGRWPPDLGDEIRNQTGIAAIVDGSSDFFWQPPEVSQSKLLVPTLELTVGLTMQAPDTEILETSALLKSLLTAMGEPSERGGDDQLVGYRWDVSRPIGDSDLAIVSKRLKAIEKQLDKLEISYRIAVYDGLTGDVHGELDQSDVTYCGPDASITLKWSGASGANSVLVNNEGFDIHGEDIRDRDAELWSS